MTPSANTPPWVSDEPLIQHILHTLLDKFERGVRPYLRISEKTAPQLYDFNSYDTEYLWGLITLLDNEHHIISIKKPKKRSPVAHYDKSQLYLLEPKITLLRDWLERPALDSYGMVWQTMVKQYNEKAFDKYGVDLTPLVDTPLRYPNKSAEQVVQAFLEIPGNLTHAKTLRTLSAQCFWGDSKFLDYRRSLIEALFPCHAQHLQLRPLLINAFIPDAFTSVLFIENQDSFISLKQVLAGLPNPPMALVYSAGFRGTAMRVRDRHAVAWSYVNHVNQAAQTRFESWWCNNDPELSTYFWGDLDYAGMAILAALRKSFTHLHAWQPGYKAMLEFHKLGICHRLEEAGKDKQRMPRATGCEFADSQLLPLMQESNLFVDQEVVDTNDLLPYWE